MVIWISAVRLNLFLYVRYIENKYLGLENGILDPSAILLSRYGYLTFMDCKVLLHFIRSLSNFLLIWRVSSLEYLKATELFNKTHVSLCLHDELVP